MSTRPIHFQLLVLLAPANHLGTVGVALLEGGDSSSERQTNEVDPFWTRHWSHGSSGLPGSRVVSTGAGGNDGMITLSATSRSWAAHEQIAGNDSISTKSFLMTFPY